MSNEVEKNIDPALAGKDVVYIGGFVTRYLAETVGASAFTMVEHELAPGLLGAPPHRHSKEDECSYVLAGTLTVWRAGTTSKVAAGEVIQKPRGEWHTFWNAESEPVRFLEIISPGGFAQYFRDLARIVAAAAAIGASPDPAALARIAAQYALEFDFDMMGKLLGEHGLKLG